MHLSALIVDALIGNVHDIELWLLLRYDRGPFFISVSDMS